MMKTTPGQFFYTGLLLSCALGLAGCSSSDSDGAASTSGEGYAGGVYAGDGDGDAYVGDSDDSGYASPSDPGQVPDGTFEAVGTNPFVVVQHDPLSTFAADVDTASYDLFRNYIKGGALPNPDSIRLEEFVNSFDYGYEPPEWGGAHPFAIHLDAAPNLVSRNTHVLRVGIQGAVAPQDETRKPTNLVFLVDASGSMQQEMSLVQKVLTETAELLQATDTISIVKYASDAGVLLPATPVGESAKIRAAIDGLIAGGSTNGAGGIDAAYAQAESAMIEGGINHVLLCTDGDFNVGNYSIDGLEELIIEKRETGITLTALGFGGGNYNDAMMERISNAGNGIYGYIGSRDDAERYVGERLLDSLVHIAKDVKLQIEFNPEYVYAYRLLGYENRAIDDDQFRDDMVDAGEIGSGHTVTALYELVFREEDMPRYESSPDLDDGEAFDGTPEVAAEDLVLVKVRYKTPDATSEDAATEVSSSLTPSAVYEDFDASSGGLQWAVAVASFAEVLKESPYADASRLGAMRIIFDAQQGQDFAREEFLGLFDSAMALMGQE